MNLVGFEYVNTNQKALAEAFLHSDKKKYILGINKFAKAVKKLIQVDGIIDDFSRVQSSKKKSVLQIDEVPKGALILVCAFGSPLEVSLELDKRGFEHFSYLSLYHLSNLTLPTPLFMDDFQEDFNTNKTSYENTYNLLADNKSKETFEKVMNFKMSFDLSFMQGFTNNHEAQYFDEEIVPKMDDIVFVDGGAYVGDSLQSLMNYYPKYKKIICIEPSSLHLGLAQKDFAHVKGIEYINCGLGNETLNSEENQAVQHNCNHNFQASKIDKLDNLISQKVDYIKLDIEGAEQDALLGAKQTIKKYHPILAVCVYHKSEDWYKVPQIVLDIRDDYDVYLRHYMEGIFETVMYFIPKKEGV